MLLLMGPTPSTYSMQARCVATDADIARKQLGLRYRDVQLGPLVILDGKDLLSLAVGFLFQHAKIFSDSMLDMDDKFPYFQIRPFFDASPVHPGRSRPLGV